MERWADFSGPPPGAIALRNAGFSGVWRYIGLGGEHKQIHAAEYRDYVAHGMSVALVAELGVDDAWASLADFTTGQARAELARADARREGIPDDVIIACAADAHASSAAQISDAVAYARGFASVLGWARTGFYGFSETSRAVHAANACRVHWRCGSEPSLEDKNWVNFWQRNRPPQVVIVRGTTCDINEMYVPLEVAGDMTPDQVNVLNEIRERVKNMHTGQWVKPTGTEAGWQAGGDLTWFQQQLEVALAGVNGKVDALAARLAESGGGVSTADLERIVREAVQQELRITGTVEITGA